MNSVKEIETELSISFFGGGGFLHLFPDWKKKYMSSQITKLLACRKTVCFFLPRCCKWLSHGMILIFCRIIYLCHVTLAKMVNISGKFYIFMKWQTMVCLERQEIVLIKGNCLIQNIWSLRENWEGQNVKLLFLKQHERKYIFMTTIQLI